MFSESEEALPSAPWLPGTVWFFPRRIPRWIVHFWNVPHKIRTYITIITTFIIVEKKYIFLISVNEILFVALLDDIYGQKK